jgi:hypothetical protein
MGSLASVQAPWLATAQPTDLLRPPPPPPAATAYSRVLPALPLPHDCRPASLLLFPIASVSSLLPPISRCYCANRSLFCGVIVVGLLVWWLIDR